MASQEIYCKNELIYKNWQAQCLVNWAYLHQNACILVGQPSVLPAKILLHDSCGPQYEVVGFISEMYGWFNIYVSIKVISIKMNLKRKTHDNLKRFRKSL